MCRYRDVYISQWLGGWMSLCLHTAYPIICQTLRLLAQGTPERFGMEAHDGEGTCGRDGTRWHSCLSRSFSYTILYLGLPFTLLAALIVRYYISVIYVESCTRGWDVG